VKLLKAISLFPIPRVGVMCPTSLRETLLRTRARTSAPRLAGIIAFLHHVHAPSQSACELMMRPLILNCLLLVGSTLVVDGGKLSDPLSCGRAPVSSSSATASECGNSVGVDNVGVPRDGTLMAAGVSSSTATSGAGKAPRPHIIMAIFLTMRGQMTWDLSAVAFTPQERRSRTR
jgi:hypothetical protein